MREAFSVSSEPHGEDGHFWLTYSADKTRLEIDGSEIISGRLKPGKSYPSIHMPRWASRLTLEICSVRVERVQDISEADAIAEGIEPLFTPAQVSERPDLACTPMPWTNYLWHGRRGLTPKLIDGWEWQFSGYTDAKDSFSSLWESINGKRPGCTWNDNPWVFAIEFKRLEQS